MLDLMKQWFHALFVDPKVRALFWSLVAGILSVELPPIPDGVLPPWAKVWIAVGAGFMIPHVREFARQKAVAPSLTQAGRIDTTKDQAKL